MNAWKNGLGQVVAGILEIPAVCLEPASVDCKLTCASKRFVTKPGSCWSCEVSTSSTQVHSVVHQNNGTFE